MPPKVAVPEHQLQPKNLNLSIQLSYYGKVCIESYYVRVFSSWIDCCTSTLITGSAEYPWTNTIDSITNEICGLTCQSSYEYDPLLNSIDKFADFQMKSGVYAVLFKIDMTDDPSSSDNIKIRTNRPISFIYIDCSPLAFEATVLIAKSDQVDNLQMTLTVSNFNPLMSKDELIPLEPVVINIEKLLKFPIHDDNTIEETMSNVYIFGEIELGGNQTKQIFCRPSVPEQVLNHINAVAYDSDSDADEARSNQNPNPNLNLNINPLAVDVNTRVCLFPGLINLLNFKELLTSSTYTLEIYKEDLNSRVFHQRNITEYNRLYLIENPLPVTEGSPLPGGTNPKGAKAPAPIATKGKPAEVIVATKPSIGPLLDSDIFLSECIWKALTASRQVRPHGVARYRLEELLASSADLLTEFARLKNNKNKNNNDLVSMNGDRDDNVVVKETMRLDVRPEKPSKPQRWSRPDDISLKSFLDRDALESQSRLDGTLAIGDQTLGNLAITTTSHTSDEAFKVSFGDTKTSVSGLTKKKHSTKRNLPHYEQFLDYSTSLLVSAELHRKLLHPQPVPSVLEEMERNINVNTADFNKTHINKSNNNNTVLKAVTEVENENASITAEPDAIAIGSLQKRLQVTPFARMVFVMRYDDDKTLNAINDSLMAVNSRALQNIQGTIRSYSFSLEESEQCRNGMLDVITGFTVIDDEVRIIVLEGLAGSGQGMQSIYMDIPKDKENDLQLKILSNPEVLFPVRLYTAFGPDMKRVRVREKLKKLARRPELYNHMQVDVICFEAINGIMSLKSATNLKTTKDLNMYPSEESINKLELLYGEAISRADIYGLTAEAERLEALKTKKSFLKDSSRNNNTVNVVDDLSVSTIDPSPNSRAGTPGLSGRRSRKESSTVGETDCKNTVFEDYLKTRPVHRVDYLAEHKELRKQAWENMLQRSQTRLNQSQAILTRLGDPAQGGKIYIYSTQTLNFKNKAYTEMRERYSKVNDATFTYSQEFTSQTLCANPPPDEGRHKITEERKKHWLTQGGFQYPKPRSTKEMISHPRRPTDARVEELKVPWVGHGDISPTAGPSSDSVDIELIKREREYIVQIRSGNDFGALNQPKFEYPFELKLVGDREKLPRGQLLTECSGKDPNFFRSIHLTGASQAKLLAEDKAKELADWEAKVKVDHLDFKVGGYCVRDKPIQADKCNDILQGEPKRLALQKLRTMKSSTGRDLSYQTTAMSILGTESYLDNPGKTLLARSSDPSKFITTTSMAMTKGAEGAGGVGKDFTLFIKNDANDSKLSKAIYKRQHPPLDINSSERSGPKWETPSSLS